MSDTKLANPSKRLLIVDDDRLVLSLISSGLSDAGYAVTTAESAEDAEAWLASGERPDLAILDVRMPGQGGLYLHSACGSSITFPS
jgi:response regulator NasT